MNAAPEQKQIELNFSSLDEVRSFCRDALNVETAEIDNGIQEDELNRRYPLGWVVFATDGKSLRSYNPLPEEIYVRHPVPAPKIAGDLVTFALPVIHLGGRVFISDNDVSLSVSDREPFGFLLDDYTGIKLQILASSSRGIVWVVGFVDESKNPKYSQTARWTDSLIARSAP